MSVRLGEVITVVTSSDLIHQELKCYPVLRVVGSSSGCYFSFFCISALNCNGFCRHAEKVGKINVSGTALGTVITIFSW